MMQRVVHESLLGRTALELDKLIVAIVGKHPSTTGALVLDTDGLVLVSYVLEAIDTQSVAKSARDIYRHSEQMINQLNSGRLYETILLTSNGYLAISDFGNGLLITLSDSEALEAVGSSEMNQLK
jgi:predicted regulator of Ras-like GTPase activity (Roadblock/LC7/MglB family)